MTYKKSREQLLSDFLSESDKKTFMEQIKEYDVIIQFYYNLPSMTTTKTITIDAICKTEAETKVRKMFPNIISLTIFEKS